MSFRERFNLTGKKVAVMADIHSNYHAFKACFDDAMKQGADSFIFLGDYVSDFASTRETMDLVYKIKANYPTVCLCGNREEYLLDHENGKRDFIRGSRSGSLLYTYEHLDKNDLDFFRGLKISDTVEINGIPVEVAHASMDNDRFYFDNESGNIGEIFAGMKWAYLLTAHSHRQYIASKCGKTVINPGSVGLPHGGTRNSKYALLNAENGEISAVLCEVSCDIDAIIRAQFERGLVATANCWAIGVLYDAVTGGEWVVNLLKHVLEVGDASDEDLWRATALHLGMKLTKEEILEFNRNHGKKYNNRFIYEYHKKRNTYIGV
jgi:predicted phosphodiesterase